MSDSFRELYILCSDDNKYLRNEIQRLQAENATLVEALEWMVNKEPRPTNVQAVSDTHNMYKRKARQALVNTDTAYEKYKAMLRVVEAAKGIAWIPPEYEADGHTMYQVFEPEMQALRDALEVLE